MIANRHTLICLILVLTLVNCTESKKLESTGMGSEQDSLVSTDGDSTYLKEPISKQCSPEDIYKLKDSAFQASFFYQIDSIRLVQYPNDTLRLRSGFIDISPQQLQAFLSDVNLDSLEINNYYMHQYHFGLAPVGYTDPKECLDDITLRFNPETCSFRINILNTFLVPDDWCTEDSTIYFVEFTDNDVKITGRQEAG